MAAASRGPLPRRSLPSLQRCRRDHVAGRSRRRPYCYVWTRVPRLSGCAPFEEDTWCAINFGAQATQLITEYPCPRCTVPNVDQATGTVDPPAVSPMRTLRDFRVRGGAVNFGVYLRPTGDLGTLKVGDGLTVQPC